MIKKLRLKIIVIMMTVVLLFLVFIFVSLYVSTASSYSRRSIESMMMSASGRPNAPGFSQVIIVECNQSSVTVLKNDLEYIDQTEIEELIYLADEDGEQSGLLRSRRIRYLRMIPFGETNRYIFSDAGGEMLALRTQLFNSLFIGGTALILFLIASIFLSKLLVKPVERAWDKQRRFIADASHELKTPLTVAMSNVDMLNSSSDLTSDKSKRRLDISTQELTHMQTLIENLLTLARADSGTIQTAHTFVDFSHIALDCAAVFEPVIYDNGKKLDIRIADGLKLSGSEDSLRRLTAILLDNACKYGKEGSVISICVEKEKHGSRQKHSERIHLSVSNEGLPISEKQLSMLFERFYRGDDSRGEIHGYGLGLSIAKSIVEEHHGTIWAESTPEGVITFHVLLY